MLEWFKERNTYEEHDVNASGAAANIGAVSILHVTAKNPKM
jgi:hypothetical protein